MLFPCYLAQEAAGAIRKGRGTEKGTGGETNETHGREERTFPESPKRKKVEFTLNSCCSIICVYREYKRTNFREKYFLN